MLDVLVLLYSECCGMRMSECCREVKRDEALRRESELCWVEAGLETFAAALKRPAGTRVGLAAQSPSTSLRLRRCVMTVEDKMFVGRCLGVE